MEYRELSDMGHLKSTCVTRTPAKVPTKYLQEMILYWNPKYIKPERKGDFHDEIVTKGSFAIFGKVVI